MQHLTHTLFILLAWIHLGHAQLASSYCDSLSSLCFQGYTDSTNGVTFGFIFPPITTPSTNEYIVQIVAPVSYGWTGLSVGGSMLNSLLFTLWPNGQQPIVGTRLAVSNVLPKYYDGPVLTIMPYSTVNSTHVKATLRCQNCTSWQGGSIGGGDLNAFQFMAYALSKSSKPANAGDPQSDFYMHDTFGYFALSLINAHDANYFNYLGGGTSTGTGTQTSLSSTSSTSTSSTTTGSTTIFSTITKTAPAPPPTTTLCAPPSTTTAIPPTASPYGQCGGTCWPGPFTCLGNWIYMYELESILLAMPTRKCKQWFYHHAASHLGADFHFVRTFDDDRQSSYTKRMGPGMTFHTVLYTLLLTRLSVVAKVGPDQLLVKMGYRASRRIHCATTALQDLVKAKATGIPGVDQIVLVK
ncbi:hypothetical protein EUX98_g2762 [Antrodiella citrinella]|uniref:Cellobiose dehydrogenase-like cytochrome domain-containing protein n=1 Tax=Antrodiella citrinella TaxID=2447956 RepID=A0A4S4MY94_9APHY|nr:hypothetical protein EUX98_g2762 [Antrodiella citrinella]